MTNSITVQIQLEPNEKIEDEIVLDRVYGEMGTMCSRIEHLGYVRCQMYLDNEVYNPK